MIGGPKSIKLDYELTRLERYKDVRKRQKYSPEEYMEAYEAWITELGSRTHLWDAYYDIRDGMPKGTNAKIHRDRTLCEWIC